LRRNKHFGTSSVSGRSLVDLPAARIIAFVLCLLLSLIAHRLNI
jgi:hypothetical protein